MVSIQLALQKLGFNNIFNNTCTGFLAFLFVYKPLTRLRKVIVVWLKSRALSKGGCGSRKEPTDRSSLCLLSNRTSSAAVSSKVLTQSRWDNLSPCVSTRCVAGYKGAHPGKTGGLYCSWSYAGCTSVMPGVQPLSLKIWGLLAARVRTKRLSLLLNDLERALKDEWGQCSRKRS